MENTHRSTNEVGKLPIEGLECGLGEHVRHRDPSVFRLIGVELVRNCGQRSGHDRLSARVSRDARSGWTGQISPRPLWREIELTQR